MSYLLISVLRCILKYPKEVFGPERLDAAAFMAEMENMGVPLEFIVILIVLFMTRIF